MSWKAIFFIVLSLSLCIGPIMMMQPNSGQRRAARLRAKALRLGLKVRSGSIGSSEGSKTMCLYFRPWQTEELKTGRTIEGFCLHRLTFEHPVHFYKYWAASSEKNKPKFRLNEKIEEILDQLPGSIHAIECYASGIGFYWDESGAEETLETFTATLEKFIDAVLEQTALA